MLGSSSISDCFPATPICRCLHMCMQARTHTHTHTHTHAGPAWKAAAGMEERKRTLPWGGLTLLVM